MADEAARRAWVGRVLGVQLPGGGGSTALAPNGDFTRRWATAKTAWLAAIESVDAQISALQARMRQSSDPDFQLIADRGLPALTGNHKTPVMVAIREVDAADGEARGAALDELRDAVAAFRTHITSDPRVTVLDAESRSLFGVDVRIAAGIGGGLDALTTALDATS
jgi:hypothetical protein